MNFLIAGLGNIGAEYADTRHNIGFKVLDAFAKASGTSFISGRYGSTCTVSVRGHKLILLKPSTYMNLSGKAVNYWLQAEKIKQENLLVVLDDLAIPFGTQRMRKQGSAGGPRMRRRSFLSLRTRPLRQSRLLQHLGLTGQ